MSTLSHATLAVSIVLLAAGCSSPKRSTERTVLLDEIGTVHANGPYLMRHERRTPYTEHRLMLREAQPVRVTVISRDQEFDPILECRPVDGAPGETLQNQNARGQGTVAQLDLLPARDGVWLLCVGDANGRAGDYRIDVTRLLQRSVFHAKDQSRPAFDAAESRPAFFCAIVEGRRYRVAVEASDFPPYVSLEAPGMAETTSNTGVAEFVALRTGQAIIRVASLSEACGPFDLRVAEIW